MAAGYPLHVPGNSVATQRRTWAVNDVVLYRPEDCRKAEPAQIRFVGTNGGSNPKDVVGMEFYRDGFGKHDGASSALGFRGFSCPPGRGLYTSPDNPRLTRAESQSQQVLSAMGTNLEERIESDVLRGKAQVDLAAGVLRAQGQFRNPVWVKRWVAAQGRYLFFDKMKPGALARLDLPPNAILEPDAEGGPDMPPPNVGSDYQGPHLAEIRAGKVSEEEAQAMFEHAAQSPDVPLHADYLLPLVWRAVDLFSSQPSLVRVDVPAGGRVLALGDTHGHLKDIIHVFRKLGFPSATNVYLINGDISDRGDTADRGGQHGLTIWTIVLCFKVLCPGSMFFNRGNHEDWYNNTVEGPYGDGSFHAEIHRRYPSYAAVLKNAFRELFYSAPIAHVIGERVLVLHGGLWRAGNEQGLQRMRARPVHLSEVERVERRQDIPSYSNNREEMILADACWNDPHDGNGMLPNPRGGDTLLFGGDVTARLCKQEGLSLVVRSHDWPRTNPPHGFEWFQRLHGSDIPKLQGQDSICLSVFTASDYCGGTGNMGACIGFTGRGGKAEEMTVAEWTADEAMVTWRGADSQSSVESQVQLRQTATFEDSLWQIKALIVEFKHELLAEFQFEDVTRDSHVPVDMFIDVLSRILGECPWDSLLVDDPSKGIAFAVATEPPSVNYMEFLSRYQIRFRNSMGKHAGFRREIAAKLYEDLLLADLPIRSTLAAIDKDGDGTVSVDEMRGVLSRVLTRVSPHQSWTMLRTVANANDHGTVSVHDFLGTFQLRFASTYAKPAPLEAPWVPGALPQIGMDILRHQQRTTHQYDDSVSASQHLKEFFVAKDVNQNGYFEFQELADALWALPSCKDLSQEQMDVLVRYCDLNDTGRINYLEFLNAFSTEANHDMAEHLHEDHLEGICRALHFNLKAVVSLVLEQYIVPGRQRCTAQEFVMALKAANASQNLLSDDQICMLADTLTLDDDGRFDFRDYFASFEIIDTYCSGDFENSAVQ